jgi:hypothetical protein
MARHYVKIEHFNGDWHSFVVRARNEQLAVWAAFDQMREQTGMRDTGGWRATEVSRWEA